MKTLDFPAPPDRPLRVLALGAHSDDIEIGCGGTLLRLARERERLAVCWVVLSSGRLRDDEARRSAERFLEGAAEKQVIVKDFKNGFFPYRGEEIKEFFEELKGRFEPDLVLTHYRDDRHQDHRVVSDLTWNSYRNHVVLEYEIPKYDGDMGAPNFFVHVDRGACERKIDILMDCFQTQSNKHWFTRDLFAALMRIRGMESCAPDGFAEAFYARKLSF